MNQNTSNNTGTDMVGLLTLLFIALKLTHVINWSWWWVLSPALIAIGVTVLIICALIIWNWWDEHKY